MNRNTTFSSHSPQLNRRTFLAASRRLTLSAGAVALLAGSPGLARQTHAAEASANDDADILNTALGAEREAIAAYELGAASGLLSAGTKALALTFRDHHRAHADLLVSTVEQLGSTPVEAPGSYDFPVNRLQSEVDVIRFAASLEQGAVSAYLGAVPLFANRDLSRAAASILGDEALHWAVLRQALGEVPVPSAFVS